MRSPRRVWQVLGFALGASTSPLAATTRLGNPTWRAKIGTRRLPTSAWKIPITLDNYLAATATWERLLGAPVARMHKNWFRTLPPLRDRRWRTPPVTCPLAHYSRKR